MYTCHLPMMALISFVPAYLDERLTKKNKKTTYFSSAHVVVDPRRVFTNLYIGWVRTKPSKLMLVKFEPFQLANNDFSMGTPNYPHPIEKSVIS